MKVTYSVELLEATINKQVERIEALEEICKRDRFADGYAAGCEDFQKVGGKRIEALEAAVREHHDAWRGTIGHLNKAAARIEALEKALREILDIGDASSGSDWGDLTVSRDIARAALAPEQDK